MSAKTEEIGRVLGFALGGDDYITKPFSPKEVAYRVKVNLRRTNQKDEKHQETVYELGLFKIDEKKMEVRKNGHLVQLKAKEYNMLLYLAKHPNQILSKEQICFNVWGEDYIGFDNTIMVLIINIGVGTSFIINGVTSKDSELNEMTHASPEDFTSEFSQYLW